jgi:hypothetical protein
VYETTLIVFSRSVLRFFLSSRCAAAADRVAVVRDSSCSMIMIHRGGLHYGSELYIYVALDTYGGSINEMRNARVAYLYIRYDACT